MTDETKRDATPGASAIPEDTGSREAVHAAQTDALAETDALFAALWKRALEAWDDDGPHRGLLEHALKTQQLPELAGRYRALKDDPTKGPRAQKQIDRIIAAATQLMFAMKTPAPTKTPLSWTLSAGLFFLLVIGWLAYALVYKRHH